MITFISGVPGTGKTALAVSMMRDYVKEGRPLVVAGIPDLNLPHEPVPAVKDWTVLAPHPDDASKLVPHFTFPKNSVVVIDECQVFYRLRSSSSLVPDHVAAFETHRHRGIDFILMSQRVNQVDRHVMGLCGKHIHLRSHWSGRQLLEWAEVNNPDSSAARAIATRRSYKLPADVFSLYKSAEVHTRIRRRIPKAVYGVALGVLLILGIGSYVGSRILGFIGGDVDVPIVPDVPGKPSAGSSGASGPASGSSQSVVAASDAVGSVAAYMPRIKTRPETAPLYDSVRRVVDVPRVAACVEFRGECRCYTQQGTSAYLSDVECRAYLADPLFQPFGVDRKQGT